MEYSQKNKIQTPSLTPPPKALPSPEALENYLCACGSGKALEACCFKTELAHLEKEVLEESEILQLPQKKHAQWEIGRFKLNTWFEDAGHLYRPELLLCSDRETGKRYGVSLLDSYHLPESLQHSLYDTLASPNEGEPHRPALVFFEDPSLLEALQKHLEALQIPFRLEQKLNHLETNRKALQEAMCPETQEWPSLSSSVSLEYFLFLSQKATQFYQKKPWNVFKESVGLEITWGKKQKGFYLVLGSNQSHFGLNLCSYKKDLEFCAQGKLRRGGKGQTLFLFGEETQCGFQDLDRWETLRWKFPQKRAYFNVAHLHQEDEDTRPLTPSEVNALEVGLLTIPLFLDKVNTLEGAREASLQFELDLYSGKEIAHIQVFDLQ